MLKEEFGRRFPIETKNLWFVHGMAQLWNNVVEGGIDTINFMQTLLEYEAYLNES